MVQVFDLPRILLEPAGDVVPTGWHSGRQFSCSSRVRRACPRAFIRPRGSRHPLRDPPHPRLEVWFEAGSDPFDIGSGVLAAQFQPLCEPRAAFRQCLESPVDQQMRPLEPRASLDCVGSARQTIPAHRHRPIADNPMLAQFSCTHLAFRGEGRRCARRAGIVNSYFTRCGAVQWMCHPITPLIGCPPHPPGDVTIFALGMPAPTSRLLASTRRANRSQETEHQ